MPLCDKLPVVPPQCRHPSDSHWVQFSSSTMRKTICVKLGTRVQFPPLWVITEI